MTNTSTSLATPNSIPSASDCPAGDSAKLDQLLQRINQLASASGQASADPKVESFASTFAPSPINAPLGAPRSVSAIPPTDAALANKATCKFGKITGNREEPFIPLIPSTLKETGLSDTLVEELILRYMLTRGEAAGRMIADQLKLPFRMVDPVLNRLKFEQLTAYRGSNSVNDYTHVLTDQGRDRARRHNLRTTYFGAAPVQLEDYVEAVKYQSVESQNPGAQDLARAFKDLLIDRNMFGRLGPAINSGKGMFLYGYPGNGKTSIAERITLAFGKHIWIPRAVMIEGEIMRLYDPLMHQEDDSTQGSGLYEESSIDRRWIRIKRPTIVAGGELTMEMLEVQKDTSTNINEAPLQLKSNCGVLLIDDFGRQKMRVDELLNRWIVPLEKRYDFLNLSSGKKTQVPFDQLVIFSTNLQPKDLVDDAFLRRIPYKIEVTNPSEEAFRKLFEILSPKLGLPYRPEAINYLVEKHYRPNGRPFRNCHPRDLLLQVRNYCLYNKFPMELKVEYLDFACENYFAIM